MRDAIGSRGSMVSALVDSRSPLPPGGSNSHGDVVSRPDHEAAATSLQAETDDGLNGWAGMVATYRHSAAKPWLGWKQSVD